MPSISIAPPDSQRDTLRVRLARIDRRTPDILAFELTHPDGRALPAVTAGAYIDVFLLGRLMRQYSLCNAARERHRYQIAVLRAMYDVVAEG